MKDLIHTLRWIGNQCGKYLLYIILISCLGGVLSLSIVYRALVTKNLIDAATLGQSSLIIKPLIILFVLILIDMSFRSITSVLSANCSAKLAANMQKKLYKHIINSNWEEQLKYHSGNLLTRLTSDVDAIITVIVSTLPSIISLTVLLVSSFATLLYLEPILAIILIIVSPLSIFVSRFYGSKLKKIYKKSQEADANYRSFVQESLHNLLILKTFCHEDENISNIMVLQNIKIKLAIKKSIISAISAFVLYFGSSIGYFAVFCFGAFNLSKGIGTFGTLTALLQLIGNIQAPFYGFASSIPQVVAAIGSAERLMELEKMSLEHKQKSDTKSITSKFNPTSIQFKNVYFSYKKNTTLLNNISFNVKPGEIIGLMGASGNGKTTLIRLILSLMNPDKGNISIHNNDERINITPDTRNLISYVPQGNTLFSGTIINNLRYGNSNATLAEIETAATSACAWDFIECFEDKLNTIIGENGIGLSEGQAQRLAIARALLRVKPILILDEATSSLDGETELNVLKAIRCLPHKPTCIIITHRPSALTICNRVLKLESGSLSEIPKYNDIKLETAL